MEHNAIVKFNKKKKNIWESIMDVDREVSNFKISIKTENKDRTTCRVSYYLCKNVWVRGINIHTSLYRQRKPLGRYTKRNE